MKLLGICAMGACLLAGTPAAATTALVRAAARPADTLPALPEFVADTPVTDAADAGPVWTLAECERYALAHHPARAAAQAAHASALAQVGAAQAANYPDLALAGGYRRWESHAFLPPAMARQLAGGTIGPFDDYNAAVKAGWVLYDFGQRGSEQDAAAARARAVEAGIGVTEARLLAGVRLGFYALLATQAARDAAWQRLGRANAHLRLAEVKKAAGAVPRADVLRVRVEVANARLAYLQGAGEVSVARAGLNAALGRRAEEALRVAAPAGEVMVPTEAQRDTALAAALTARPEMRAAVERSAAKRAAVQAARAAYRPKLRADASGGYRDDDFAPVDEDWSVGVSFTLPIFNGYLFDHNLARAEAELAQEEAEQERLAVTVRQEICAAHAQCLTAQAAAGAARVLAADAAESLRLARARYAAGAGTVNDLLDAQANLAEAELAQAGAEFQQRLALAIWQRVTQTEP